MNVQSLIKHTMLDNAVALFWSHGACTQTVPGGLAMALDPLLHMGDILLGVLEWLALCRLVAGDPVWLCSLAGLEGCGPTSVLDVRGEMVWTSILVTSFKIHVQGTGW